MYEGNRDIDSLKPHMAIKVRRALKECRENGCDVRVSEALRSDERQKYLLGQGRTAWDLENNWGIDGSYAQPEKNVVTLVRKSKHQLGCAVDIYFNIPGDIYRDSKRPIVAPIFVKHGMNWGYEMWQRDKPHFEDNGQPPVEIEEGYYETIYNKEKGNNTIIKYKDDAIDRLVNSYERGTREFVSELVHYIGVGDERLEEIFKAGLG